MVVHTAAATVIIRALTLLHVVVGRGLIAAFIQVGGSGRRGHVVMVVLVHSWIVAVVVA